MSFPSFSLVVLVDRIVGSSFAWSVDPMLKSFMVFLMSYGAIYIDS